MKNIAISERASKIFTFGFVFALLAMTAALSVLILNGHTSTARGFCDQMMSIGLKSLVMTVLCALCSDYIDKKDS